MTTRVEQQQADIDALLGNKYQILCHVGGGGMAQVLLARHRAHGGLFAIKILADHLAQDPSIVARFKQEATTAASLSGHPNIVPIFDIGEGRGLHYLVMQFVSGEDMSSYLRREGKLSIAAAAGVIAQAAEALCWAESKHVVHRDLKPANMHLDTTGRIKILDFGISKITDVAEADGLTRPGEALGTPFYMSPEQIRGEACDSRSDLYSLGVVFFELLTGHRPFENQSATAIQIAHLSTPPPSVLQYDATIPPMCDEIIQRLLRKDRTERYSSVDELLKQLHGHGASSGPSTLRPVMAASLCTAIDTPTLAAAIPVTPAEPAPVATPAPVAAAATPAPFPVTQAPTGVRNKRSSLTIGIAAAAVLALAAGGTAYVLHERSHAVPAADSTTPTASATGTTPAPTIAPSVPAASPVPAEAAKLLVRTKQAGVQVYVNGVPKGQTAANGQLLVDTTAGVQDIRVDKAGFKAAPPAASGGSPAAAGEASAPMHASTAAALQKDGTTRTFADAGQGLPPIELKQEGWPALPPEATCTFQAVVPANLLPGTTLYALTDADGTAGSNSFWTADPPVAATPHDAWNSGSHVLVLTIPQGDPVKGWAGEGVLTGKLQVWVPADVAPAAAIQRFRMAGAA